MLDAPVSGGEIGAINAQLSIMVGGDEAAFNRAKPILAKMGNPEKVDPHRPLRRRADLQGLQPDRDRRRARRRQRSVRAREEGRRRRRARAPGAARRLRGEPRARGPRRADADRQLQAGIPRQAVSEGHAARERSGGGQRRLDAGQRRRRAAAERADRVRAAAISTTPRWGRCSSRWRMAETFSRRLLGEHHRRLHLAIGDVPVLLQQPVLLLRIDDVEAVLLVEADRPDAAAQVPISTGREVIVRRCDSSLPPIPWFRLAVRT